MAPGSKPLPRLLLGEKVARPKAVTDEGAIRRDLQHLCGRFVKRPYGENVPRSNQQTHFLSPAAQRAAEGVGPYKQVCRPFYNNKHHPKGGALPVGNNVRYILLTQDAI